MNLPTIPDVQRDEAVHGSFCPKLCNYACPVVQATGREDATPWSFHRTIADVATGRRELTDGDAHQLRGCTGCLACQGACEPNQNVPAQVVAGRTAARAAGVAQPEVQVAVDHVAAGRSPFGDTSDVVGRAVATAEVAILVGCRDDAAVVAAATRLLDAAGVAAEVVVPVGCCGGVLAELGAADEAGACAAKAVDKISAPVVLTLDPHCVPALTSAGATVRDVIGFVAELEAAQRLTFSGTAGTIAYHDPCLSARRDGVVAPPRALLAAAGFALVEPEGTGLHTVCSGAGLGAEIVAPHDAAAVGAVRSAQLAQTGVPIATGCSGARERLRTSGADVQDLLVTLADRLVEEDA